MKTVLRAMLIPVLFTVFATTASTAAQASDNIILGLSLNRSTLNTEGPTIGTGESTALTYDLKIGKVSDWLYLGGIYSVASNTSNGGSEVKRTALGATAGYHDKGFLLDLSYFLTAKKDASATVLNKGTGFGLDIGYNWMMGQSFFLGLQMVYRKFTYEEVEASGVTTTQENKVLSETYPMINLGLAF